jgi:hypothetical protein
MSTYVLWSTLVVAIFAVVRSWALEVYLRHLDDELDLVKRLCTALALDSIHGNSERAKAVIAAAKIGGDLAQL